MSTYTLSSTAPGAITLTAGGAYGSPFTITSTGSINAPSAPETYGALTGVVLATVTNAGHVTSNRYGIYLRDGGLLTNTGSIYADSNGVKGEHITGITRHSPGNYTFTYNTDTTTLLNSGYVGASSYAVQFNYGGSVSNFGNGTIAAGSYGTGIAIHDLPGTVTNSSTVLGGVDIDLTNGGYVSNASSGVLLTTAPSFGDGVELGAGDATVINAGHITAGYAGVYDRGGDIVDIRNSGVITGATVTSNYGYSAGIWAYGVTGGVTIENSGTIESAQGAGGEAVTITSAALDLIIDHGASFVGSVTADAGDTNIIELTSGSSAGAITGIGSQFTGFETIAIDLGASWTIGGGAAGLLNGTHINGVTSRDTIDLTGTLATSDSFNSSTGVLTLFNAGNAEIGTLQLELNTLIAGTTFAVTSDGNGGTDITTNAICYLRGTSIATASGEMAVEEIKIGDLVATRAGGLRPVRWIGRQSFARRFVRNNRSKVPVHIRAGALGNGLPARDLFISPGHSMLVGEVLILARNLVNGVTITQDFGTAGHVESIEYYQLELGGHDCILAEGSWSESFADGPGLRAQFHNIAEYLAEHPDYVEPPQVSLCAPRPEKGALFEQALLPVLAVAAAGLEPGPLEGWIDDISDERIAGWAIDTDHPELPVQLQVWAGEALLGTALACEHRADLETAGKGSGRSAFYFALPLALREVAQAGLRISRAGDASGLPLAEPCRARLQQAA